MVFRALQPQGQQQQTPAQQTPSGFRPLQQQFTSEQLIERLGGALPLTSEQQATRFQPTVGTLRQTTGDVQQRQEAFSQLQERGFTREQLQQTLRIQTALDRPKIGRTVGAIAGTLAAGRLIPGPIDDAAIFSALIGAFAAGTGGVAGEAIQTGIEERRLIGKREALSVFLKEASLELGGRAAVGGGKLLLSPFIKKTVPEAAALVDDYAKVGGSFSPTELDRRFSLRVGEAFSRGGFGAEQIFQEFEENQGKTALVFANNIIDNISDGIARQTPREIGEEFAKGLTRPDGFIFKTVDDLFDSSYQRLDDLTKSFIVRETAEFGVPSTILDEAGKPFETTITRTVGERIKGTGVSTKSLKNFRAKVIAQNQRLVDISKRTGKELPLVTPAGKELLEDIDRLPAFVGHQDYRAFSTKALRDARKLGRDFDSSEALVKEIAGITRKELLDPKSVAGASIEAKRLHANLGRLYANTQDALQKDFTEKLVERLLKNPSKVVKEVIPLGNPKGIEILRKSLIEPISGIPNPRGKLLWNQLRQAWLADAVEEATKEGVVNPRRYNTILRKLGREGFEELFPEPSVRASVDKIQDLFSLVGKRAPAGLSLFSRGAQTVGAVKLWQGAKAGDILSITSGGLLSIGPLAFAKLATNPKGIKFLTAGLKLKPGASGLVPNAVRMVRLLREISRKENKERTDRLRKSLQRRQAATVPTLRQLRGFGGRGF